MNKAYKYFVIWIFLLVNTLAFAQINVTFEDDNVGQVPSIAPGNGTKPSGLFGDYQNTMTIQNVSGTIGSSQASGKVVEIDVAATGNFNLLEFDALLNTGMISSGIVKVSFDFLAFSGENNDGFGFLRNIDDSDETIADLGFNFDGDTFNIGILDYDPLTGAYLEWKDPGFPNNTFNAGEWYNIESTINLDNNTHTLKINGVDYGVTAGVSRATGTSYIGSFFNLGTAFEGKAAMDNFKVEILNTATLPNAPAELVNLLNLNPTEGNVIRIPNGDFRQTGIDWESNLTATLFLKPYYQNINTYTVTVNTDLDEADARLFSFNSFPFIPNRTYEVSAVVRTNFPRATWELNIGYHGSETETPTPNEISLGARYSGLPSITSGPDGWERWTWQFTPHWDDNYTFVNVFLGLHEYGPGFDGNVTFDIADIAFIELPEIPLSVPAPGEGVTLPGGNGNLTMAVENVDASTNPMKVTVTGAEYEFDTVQGTLTAKQRIDFERTLTVIDQLPLDGLAVQSQTANEVVLVGTNMTIGVQMDGAVIMRPHTSINPIITNKIGGDFNRVTVGDLLSLDDFGGFTVNTYSPKGSGNVPEITPITVNLPFENLSGEDLVTTGAYNGEWTATTNVQPGELLFVSVFPSKPFNWEKSFEHFWDLNDFNGSLNYNDPEYVDDWVLWNFSERGWAMSFGERYELRDNIPAQNHFDAVALAGDKWSAYFSQWFYYSRDAEEWTNEVLRWKNEYGMGAVYSDGMAQDDFLSAYEAMRRLRENVFPDGDILIHDSFPQSGIPAAAFKPFIYSYATSTYMGENAQVSVGADWAWARYAMSQFRRSNALGVIKGDGWTGFEGVEKYLISLVWGGRGRPDVAGFDTQYIPVLNQLKQLWETYGSDPFFFDRYYHPEAQILTNYNIGRAGMPIFELDETDPTNPLLVMSSWTPNSELYYTTDGTEATASSTLYTNPIPYTNNLNVRVRAFRNDLDESREAFLADFVLSTEELNTNIVLSLYPNPATDEVYINLKPDNFEDLEIVIHDITGKKIQQLDTKLRTNERNTITVDVHNLAAGIYIITGNNNGQKLFQEKLIVN